MFKAISTYMGQLRWFLEPVLTREEPLEPLAFVHEMLAAIAKHTKRESIDLNAVIVMGWSEAQTNPDVKALVTVFQTRYRAALTHVVQQWQQRQYVSEQAEPEDVAKALLSFFLGAIVQEALLGNADPATLTRGLEDLLGAKSLPARPTLHAKQKPQI